MPADLISINYVSKVLAGNPLKDPVERSIVVFRPVARTSAKLPLVVYLPGFGGSGMDVVADPKPWQAMIDKLHDAGVDLIFAVVDGRNRYGCSQYINSSASGRYEDYICDELVPYVEKRFNCGGSALMRIVAGHSSGGFGALRLGMSRQKLFGGVIALSPDSYFEVTHRPFTESPDTRDVGLANVEKMMPPELAPLTALKGDAGYCLALCADYAPAKGHSGKFEWLYDAQAKYRNDVWNRWLDNDPAVLAERSPQPFSDKQFVYLDGAAQDDFKANVGAAKVAGFLKVKFIKSTLDFPPGHHSDHLQERIERGIRWYFAKPLNEIN